MSEKESVDAASMHPIVRHPINMDGMIHGPIGYGADCEIESPIVVTGLMQCGNPCKCGVGVVHWQPVYGGYYFKCDACELESSSEIDFV